MNDFIFSPDLGGGGTLVPSVDLIVKEINSRVGLQDFIGEENCMAIFGVLM